MPTSGAAVDSRLRGNDDIGGGKAVRGNDGYCLW